MYASLNWNLCHFFQRPSGSEGINQCWKLILLDVTRDSSHRRSWFHWKFPLYGGSQSTDSNDSSANGRLAPSHTTSGFVSVSKSQRKSPSGLCPQHTCREREIRSEERRVGKERRSRWSPYH